MAIMRRARSLAIISEPTYRNFCITANKRRWRSQGEPGDSDYRGCESDGRFRQLVRRAMAEETISSSKAAALLRQPLRDVRKDLEQVIG